MTRQTTSHWSLVRATWGPSPQMWLHPHPLAGPVLCLSSPSIFLPFRTTTRSPPTETEQCFHFCFNLFFFSSYLSLYLDFWLCRAACGIIVPYPGIKPVTPCFGSTVLTTGQPGKSQQNGVFATLFCWADCRQGSALSILFSIPVAFPKQMPSPPQKESAFNLHKKPLACDCFPHYRRGHWGWEKLHNFPKLAGLINREPRFEFPFICLKVCVFPFRTAASFAWI